MKRLIALLILLIPGVINASSKRDFQIWTNDGVSASFNKIVKFYAEVEFRFRDDASRFFYNHEHIELPIFVFPWLAIGPCYRQVFVIPFSQRFTFNWITIYEPNLNVTFFWKLWKLHFFNRSRVTYRIFQEQPDVWQFRDRFGFNTTNLGTPLKINLFVNDEIFIQQNRHGIYQNRFTAGIDFRLISKLRGQIGYRLQTIKEFNGWNNNDILILNAYANF